MGTNKTDVRVLQSEYADLEQQLLEFADLVANYRSAEKEMEKLRFSQDGEKKAYMADMLKMLRLSVDSELHYFLEDRA